MTTDGNFNINNLNTVKVPAVTTGVQGPYIAGSGNDPYDKTQFYYDDTYFYSYPVFDSAGYRARVNDIYNGEQILHSQIGGYTDAVTLMYPHAIGGYYYGFGSIDEFDIIQGGTIWRAPIGEPMAWYNTGSTTDDRAFAMIYVDDTDMYLIGGLDSADAVLATTRTAAISAPLTWSAGTALPAERANGTLVVVGSTIYMYGGVDVTPLAVNTIWSASTAAPDVWTDTTDTIPAQLYGMAGYNDGTYVWLFGGEDETNTLVNTIYRAPVGTPTTFTSVGTIPAAKKNLQFYANGIYGYLFYEGVIYRALLSDLTTWTTLSNYIDALAVDVRCSHVLRTDTHVYMIGGYTDSSALDATKTDHIQSATVTNPLEWTDLGAILPADIAAGELIKTKNFYYIIGADGGNYYSAPVATPTVWTLAGTDGPSSPRGRAMIHDGQLWYIGGEFILGTSSGFITSCTIDSSSVPAGDLSPWKGHESVYHNMTLPVVLSRFALVKSGCYAYVLGGCSSAVMNTKVYRINLNDVNFGWVEVATIGNPKVDACVAVINNFVYIIGGGPNATFNTVDDYVLSCSMSDLANGNANFIEENTGAGIAAEASATVINDDIYFIGGRFTTAAGDSILRTTLRSDHVLVLPRVPETSHSLPTIDLKSGNLGTYSSFQRTGLLPWLVSDK